MCIKVYSTTQLNPKFRSLQLGNRHSIETFQGLLYFPVPAARVKNGDSLELGSQYNFYNFRHEEGLRKEKFSSVLTARNTLISAFQ